MAGCTLHRPILAARGDELCAVMEAGQHISEQTSKVPKLPYPSFAVQCDREWKDSMAGPREGSSAI